MQYRNLGTSDVKVSTVILGTWAIGGWMWGGTDDEAALAAIDKAIEVGVTSIDTAPAYGFGHSEKIIGKAIAGKQRDKLQILTKYGLTWDRGSKEAEHFDTVDNQGNPITIYRNAKKESVIKECEDSLRRLGTDYIDLYQCHWPDVTTPFEETMEAMDKLLKDGKIRAAGVSNFSPEQMERCLSVIPIASDQPPFSMLKREIENDVMPYALQHNISLIVYSPLQRGILTGKVTMDREFPEDDARSRSPFYQPKNRRKILDFLNEIKPIAEAHDATLAQLVINWTIHQQAVTAALVGARRPKQAEENAKAADFTLTEEEMQTINSKLAQLELDV